MSLEALPRGPWSAWLQLGDLQRTHPEPAPPDLNEFGGLRLPEAVRLLEEPPPWSSPEEARQPIRDWVFGYARAVRATDGQVQGLIRAVAERGELHRTLIVVVSEGGTPLGEEGHWFDAPRALEEELLLVPWIVVGPGVQAGTWVGGPCSLVDLAPTMIGLAGVSAGRPGGD